MGCALEGATVLPPFPALKSIRICTHGNVSIVIPAESHVEELWLRADVVDFSTEDWRSFAARMQSVTFFFNQIRGAGFRDLQTLHACGNMKVREHAWYCELSPGVSTARLFSASRIVEGADEPEGSSEEEESEDESEIEEGIEDRSISGESELW
ncbi:g3863 [Coccomyxa elongata]